MGFHVRICLCRFDHTSSPSPFFWGEPPWMLLGVWLYHHYSCCSSERRTSSPYQSRARPPWCTGRLILKYSLRWRLRFQEQGMALVVCPRHFYHIWIVIIYCVIFMTPCLRLFWYAMCSISSFGSGRCAWWFWSSSTEMNLPLIFKYSWFNTLNCRLEEWWKNEAARNVVAG